jgi:hypothetical protein
VYRGQPNQTCQVADRRRAAQRLVITAVFDLELIAESVEDGEVRGLSLVDQDAGFAIALRERQYCAGDARTSGLDVVALRSPTRELRTNIAERSDRLGVRHTHVWDFPGYGVGWISRPRRRAGPGRSAAGEGDGAALGGVAIWSYEGIRPEILIRPTYSSAPVHPDAHSVR